VFVVVALVLGVPVALMHIIHMVPVGYGHVPAALTVLVRVTVVRGVDTRLAFVRVIAVHGVEVTVVRVVHVLVVRDRDMAAALTVLMSVLGVGCVCSAHGSLRSSFGSRPRSVRVRRGARFGSPTSRSSVPLRPSAAFGCYVMNPAERVEGRIGLTMEFIFM
jgi:hypothetical protein